MIVLLATLAAATTDASPPDEPDAARPAAALVVELGDAAGQAPPPAVQGKATARGRQARPRMKMPTSMFGVHFDSVPEEERAANDLPQGVGLAIASVDADSPASLVGLEPHDILTRFGDQIVCDAEQVAALVESRRGKTATLTVLRDGKKRVFRVGIMAGGENPDLRTPEIAGPVDRMRDGEGRRVGQTRTRVADVRKNLPGLPRGTGVRIEEPAVRLHLEPGDIISRFDDQIVCTAGQLDTLMRLRGSDTVTIRFIRDGRGRTVKVDLGGMNFPWLRPGDFAWSLEETWTGGDPSRASSGTVTPRGVERIESVVIGSKTLEVRLIGKDVRYLIRDGNGRRIQGGPLNTIDQQQSVPEEYRGAVKDLVLRLSRTIPADGGMD